MDGCYKHTHGTCRALLLTFSPLLKRSNLLFLSFNVNIPLFSFFVCTKFMSVSEPLSILLHIRTLNPSVAWTHFPKWSIWIQIWIWNSMDQSYIWTLNPYIFINRCVFVYIWVYVILYRRIQFLNSQRKNPTLAEDVDYFCVPCCDQRNNCSSWHV